MSSDGIPEQAEIKCCNPQCDQSFVVMMPRAEVINTMSVSMVVWAHSDVQACPHCGHSFVAGGV